MSFATCKGAGCGARIRWVKTPQGKNMPVDVDGTPAREYLPADRKSDVFVITTPAGEFSCEPRVHVSHWATCPASRSFRGKKPEGTEKP